jgi:hypothetical protein
MNSLPTELNLKVLHHVRDSTPTLKFSSYAVSSMRQANAYNEFLLLMALLHRHWTALAQSELFHHIVLVYQSRTRSLLNLLSKRENDHFRTYAQTAASIRVGYERTGYAQDYDDLKDHLDELAGYCPNIVEISCAGVKAMFSDFGELSAAQAQTKLINLVSRRNFQEARQAELLRREPRWIRFILVIDHRTFNAAHPTTHTPQPRFLSLSSSFVLRLLVRQLCPIHSPTTTSDHISPSLSVRIDRRC